MTKIIEFSRVFSLDGIPPLVPHGRKRRIRLFNGRLHIISRNDVKAKYQSF